MRGRIGSARTSALQRGSASHARRADRRVDRRAPAPQASGRATAASRSTQPGRACQGGPPAAVPSPRACSRRRSRCRKRRWSPRSRPGAAAARARGPGLHRSTRSRRPWRQGVAGGTGRRGSLAPPPIRRTANASATGISASPIDEPVRPSHSSRNGRSVSGPKRPRPRTQRRCRLADRRRCI